MKCWKGGEKVDIRLIPAAVCGDENRRAGIILAKSKLAKEMGVVTGESIYQAIKKCPRLKTFKTDFKAYKKHSDALFDLLSKYTYKIERFSIDECFLDMTSFLMGDTLINKAYEINRKVKEKLRIYCQCGNFK